MPLDLVTSPVIEPVNLAQAKAAANISGSVDDGLLRVLIAAARAQAETITHRVLVTSTWDFRLNAFPESNEAIEIPLPPLQSVTSITYLDAGGDTQTVDAADYVVDTASEPGMVYLAPGKAWPGTQDIRNAVTLRFVAGYPITSVAASTISAAAADDSFNDSASGFGSFRAGQGITVAGFTEDANNGEFFVTLATAAKLTTSGALTLEAAGGAVTIQASACPRGIQQWVLARVCSLYEQRENFVVGVNFNELNSRFLDGLLDPFVVPMVV